MQSETKNRVLMVAFGGLDLSGKGAQIGDTPFAADEEEEDWPKSPADAQSLKKRLIGKLNSLSDVTSVEELLPVEGSDMLSGIFAPILLSIRLPVALQRLSRFRFTAGQEIENFQLVFDGRQVIYAAEVDLQKPFSTFTFVHARDRFIELLEPEFSPSTTAPNVSTGILILRGNVQIRSLPESMHRLQMPEGMTWKEALAGVYIVFAMPMEALYFCVRLRLRAMKLAGEIQARQSIILKTLSILLSKPWYRVRSRHSLVRSVRRDIISTLELLSKYLEVRGVMKQGHHNLRLLMSHDRDFKAFMGLQNWREYVEEEVPVQIENTSRTLEHVRSESQSFAGSTTSYLSAIIGAISGAIVTLIVTQSQLLLDVLASIPRVFG